MMPDEARFIACAFIAAGVMVAAAWWAVDLLTRD
jgi:hypothetical protein